MNETNTFRFDRSKIYIYIHNIHYKNNETCCSLKDVCNDILCDKWGINALGRDIWNETVRKQLKKFWLANIKQKNRIHEKKSNRTSMLNIVCHTDIVLFCISVDILLWKCKQVQLKEWHRNRCFTFSSCYNKFFFYYFLDACAHCLRLYLNL